jgi:hypothetical protein
MRTLLRAILCLASLALGARQTVVRPYQVSPAASVSQDLGLSSVRIDYHRPAVQGRKIWGGLVPFGQVWRAGANEATVITFSDPVRIGGQDLAAGAYAFFAIPGPDQWTLIFNRQAKQWGAFSYQAGQDALRIQARPAAEPPQEYLAYRIQVQGPGALRVELAWAGLAVGFDLTVDAQGGYWAYLNRTLAGAGPEEWQPLNQAANYCLLTGTHLDQAMVWIDRSLQIKEGARNLQLKAQLLRRAGRTGEALPLLEKAIELATASGSRTSLEELEALRAEWNKP